LKGTLTVMCDSHSQVERAAAAGVERIDDNSPHISSLNNLQLLNKVKVKGRKRRQRHYKLFITVRTQLYSDESRVRREPGSRHRPCAGISPM
jgi:hypothetical protein